MNVAIYGSCVSRDVLRVHPVAPVAAYAARSSWVSALTPPVAEPDADIGLASDFQARMVRDDFASTAPAALDAGDALLLDLTDERFGVIEYGGASSLRPMSSAVRRGTTSWWGDGSPSPRTSTSPCSENWPPA